ncbi:hypothetical protein RJ55_04918 [Drechmeria coniospora]|nr:hypothetical protein RJ55_04918 [Drechmeria coniospora]
MSYNQYGGNPYGAPPPGYGGYGSHPPPGMGAPPGLVPPPGMASSGMGPPGMAPPGISAAPGVQSYSAPPTSNRPGNLPSTYQPINMPANINFSAPVIRLGTSAPAGGREGPLTSSTGVRSGIGGDRGDRGGDRGREQAAALFPPTADDKLRAIAVRDIPGSLCNDGDAKRLLNAIGRLQSWETSSSLLEKHNPKYGYAIFEEPESVSMALKIFGQGRVEVPAKRQAGTAEPSDEDSFEGIDKVAVLVSADESVVEQQESLAEAQENDDDFQARLETAKQAVKQVQRELFYPSLAARADAAGEGTVTAGETSANVEVVNISIAQEDELADVPAEMREMVAKEIASFRDRSTQRDVERARREEEIVERYQKQNGVSSSNIPLGPRSATVPSAPSGARGQNGTDRGVSFVNGSKDGLGEINVYSDDDGDASDNALYVRHQKKHEGEAEKKYLEAERKWLNRERIRQQALEREQERERQESEVLQRRKNEQCTREMSLDDDVEASRKNILYYRDHEEWARKRNGDLSHEVARDDADRREEDRERAAKQEQSSAARGPAGGFPNRPDGDAQQRPAPQPFKLSLGAAAQRAQASRALPQRRTMAEVENLLDDEDNEPTVKRQLIPLQMDALSASATMTDEELAQAVRTLAQEIPTDKEGLWAWEVKWEHMDESTMHERLRSFVEKKIVEYLGVQEEMLVETVEEHIRKRGTAPALVEELEGALDDEAEDLVKKLWRMVIFFTECEKRGLSA